MSVRGKRFNQAEIIQPSSGAIQPLDQVSSFVGGNKLDPKIY